MYTFSDDINNDFHHRLIHRLLLFIIIVINRSVYKMPKNSGKYQLQVPPRQWRRLHIACYVWTAVKIPGNIQFTMININIEEQQILVSGWIQQICVMFSLTSGKALGMLVGQSAAKVQSEISQQILDEVP